MRNDLLHIDLTHIDLTFPSMSVGVKEAPRDLKRLLFKGGASIRPRQVNQSIQDGVLGDPVPERVDLVCKVHECINGRLVRGGREETTRSQIGTLLLFWIWADKSGATLSLPEIVKTYLEWTEHLLHRFKVEKTLEHQTAYTYATVVGQILDEVLGRATCMFRLSRIKVPKRRKTAQGAKADKQNLQGTFAFGRLIQDICDGLTLDAIWGPPLPLRIPRQEGGEIVLNPNSWNQVVRNKWEKEGIPLKYEADQSLKPLFRRNLVNRRILAELLMFIGQTGMNLSQAQNLRIRHFTYSSDIDGYKVLDYKHRRGGKVLFEIFADYRSHFERYLAWRRELFPVSEKKLFPLIRPYGVRETRRFNFEQLIIKLCKQAGVPWVSPQSLRGTRVNWLMRRTADPTLTADMAQHAENTLLEDYETPSLQRAVVEVGRFWQRNDPDLIAEQPLHSVAPGSCDGKPKPSSTKPDSAPEPDCRRPSGCLWCDHHRDIDSLEYVWSLACFRHLKILELSKQSLPAKKETKATHPADHAINRLSGKLSWFRDSNATRREWVEEAFARVEEGHYHDQWSYLINNIEGPSK